MQEPKHDHKDLFKKFGEGRAKVAVRFSPQEVFNKTFLFKNHREYIKHLFKTEHNMEVIQFEHNYNDDSTVRKCGLIFTKTDSDLVDMVEVWGIEGVSVVAIGKTGD